MISPLDPRDIFYLVAGAAFLGFTVIPLFSSMRLISVPTVYVAAGALLAWLGLPALDPLAGDLQLAVIEHATELIVIVSIAGAGLAVDRPMGRKSWHHTWLLLAVTMPLTIAALAFAGVWLAGLPIATAILLGACLAPTDPVLARSVQVKGPNQGEENDVRVSLTTEAGLNDSLAFPFVYLALALEAIGGGSSGDASEGWFWHWLGFDLVYRVAFAVIIGGGAGYLLSRFIFSRFGDAKRGGENAGLVLLSGTFLAYGLAEAIDAYGFLAVFVCARASRANARGAEDEAYASKPHHFSDQFEKILLALLLVWLGGFCVSGVLDGFQWIELAIAAGLILVIRPLAGWSALWPTKGSRLDHVAIATLGIRGLGTVFYIAYAQSHAHIEGIDVVWRISLLAILISIAVHGVLSQILMSRLKRNAKGSDQPGDCGQQLTNAIEVDS